MRSVLPPPAESLAMPGICVGAVGPRRESKPQPCGERGYSTTADRVPLKVVYWNVAGVRAADIHAFLEQLDVDLRWAVLVLLECSQARHEFFLSGVRQAGHLVSAQPWERGRRVGSLVFNERLQIREGTLVSQGRAFGVDFSWGGWKIRTVGGHADPSGDRAPCPNSIDDMDFITENTPKEHIVILDVDTQTCLGPLKAFDS